MVFVEKGIRRCDSVTVRQRNGGEILEYKLSAKAIKAIEVVLSREERVELIPIKNGEIKVIRIRRQEIK